MCCCLQGQRRLGRGAGGGGAEEGRRELANRRPAGYAGFSSLLFLFSKSRLSSADSRAHSVQDEAESNREGRGYLTDY